MDCTTYTVSNVRPFKGCVLVELLQDQRQMTPSLIAWPESVSNKAGCGRVAEEGRQSPPVECLVRKIGHNFLCDEIWLGDRVIIHRHAGRQINEVGKQFRLVKASEILAKFV